MSDEEELPIVDRLALIEGELGALSALFDLVNGKVQDLQAVLDEKASALAASLDEHHELMSKAAQTLFEDWQKRHDAEKAQMKKLDAVLIGHTELIKSVTALSEKVAAMERAFHGRMN